MGIGGVRVDYTDGGGLQHSWQRYAATTDDGSAWLAGDGSTIDLAAATPIGSIDNAGQLIRAFLKSYEFIASVGSSIRSLSADFRATGGPGIVDGTANYFWSGFTPDGDNAGYGPYKTGFGAIRSRGQDSRRPAWIRFYTTGAKMYSKATLFAPSSIDADFASWLTDLTHFSGSVVNFAVWSGYTNPDGSWEGLLPFNTGQMRIGASNG